MSLEAVLKSEPNVMSLSETPVLTEKPIWDRFNFEDIVFPMDNRAVPFLGIDIFSDPRIKEIVKDFKNSAADLEERNSWSSNFDLNSNLFLYLEKSACARLLERALDKPLENETVKEFCIQEKNYFENHLFIDDDVLDLALNFKICFLTEDLDSLVDIYLIKYLNYINETLKDNIHINVDDAAEHFRNLAIIKLIRPNKFDNIDVRKSILFNRANRFLNDSCFVTDDFYNYIDLISYLKFFADEKAVLGPRGIELTMPEEKIESPTLALPDRRKF